MSASLAAFVMAAASASCCLVASSRSLLAPRVDSANFNVAWSASVSPSFHFAKDSAAFSLAVVLPPLRSARAVATPRAASLLPLRAASRSSAEILACCSWGWACMNAVTMDSALPWMASRPEACPIMASTTVLDAIPALLARSIRPSLEARCTITDLVAASSMPFREFLRSSTLFLCCCSALAAFSFSLANRVRAAAAPVSARPQGPPRAPSRPSAPDFSREKPPRATPTAASPIEPRAARAVWAASVCFSANVFNAGEPCWNAASALSTAAAKPLCSPVR